MLRVNLCMCDSGANFLCVSMTVHECLSRQSSLVINIVGTDDISRLPRLVTGLTEAPPPPLLSCVYSSVCCFAIPAHPPGD
jgi:hypothetical protein